MFTSMRRAAIAGIAALTLFATLPAFAKIPENTAPKPMPTQAQQQVAPNGGAASMPVTNAKDFSTAESRRAILNADRQALRAAKASGDKAAIQKARMNMHQDAMAAKQAVSASSQNRESLMNRHDAAHQSPSKMNGTSR